MPKRKRVKLKKQKVGRGSFAELSAEITRPALEAKAAKNKGRPKLEAPTTDPYLEGIEKKVPPAFAGPKVKFDRVPRDQFYLRTLSWPDGHCSYYVAYDGFDVHFSGEDREDAAGWVEEWNRDKAESAAKHAKSRPRKHVEPEVEGDGVPSPQVKVRPKLGNGEDKPVTTGPKANRAELRQAIKTIRELRAAGAPKAQIKAQRAIIKHLKEML